MAEILKKIEVQETSKGESAEPCGKLKFRWWKSDKEAVVSEFLTETSLHGLKYIGQPKRHIVERMFWIVAFVIGLSAAGILIYGVFNRYEETPVTVTFQSKEQSVNTIPFPAVTFCFNNQFSKEKVESLSRRQDDLKEGEPEHVAISEKLSKINRICSSQKSLLDTYFERFIYSVKPRSDYYYRKNQTQLQQETIDLLLELTPSCKDMIPFTVLDGNPVQTKFKIFNPVITEYGKCCTFNMLPPPLMLKQPSVRKGDVFSNPVLGTDRKRWWNQAAIDDWSKWNYRNGFILSPESYKSRIFYGNAKISHPFRNQRLGYRFGLSVVIDTFEPYCDKVTFRGTTFMLHNPVDTPRVTQFPSVIGVNQEVFIKIHPDISLADPDIKNLKREKRQCLFGNEKRLKYFRPYTQENCFEECIADLIEKECSCSLFNMPRRNETLLCLLVGESTEGNCVINTLSLFSTQEMCGDCLPLCDYIAYNFEMTSAKILNLNYSSDHLLVIEMWNEHLNRSNQNPSDINQNISIAHIFYGSPSTVPKLRKRLYGVTDLIANTGGILGLCLGFSVLSGGEVLYYVLMKTIWQMLARCCQWGNKKESSDSSKVGKMKLENPTDLSQSGIDKKSKFKWTKVFSKFGRKNPCTSLIFKWLCCILVGSATSAFLVYILLVKKEDNIQTKDVFQIPLESDEDTEPYYAQATFCLVNQFSMEKVLELRRIAKSITDENHRYSAETNLSIIDAMCKYKDALATSSSTRFPPLTPGFANYTFLMTFLEENTISCNQMFPACIYMGMAQENCSKIIQSVDTVYGKCCRINVAAARPKFLNSSDSNTTSIAESSITELDSITGPNQNFITENPSLFKMVEFNSAYFTVLGAESHDDISVDMQSSHFSLLLDLNKVPYQCQNSTTSTSQILFALHLPGEFLRMQDFSLLDVANDEVVITVFPETPHSDNPEENLNNEEDECSPYYWWTSDNIYRTTKAAFHDGCSRRFLSWNCKCSLFGYVPYAWSSYETSTCNTESNSNDTICLRKMRDLVSKLKHLCHHYRLPCSGTVYDYKTTNQSMTNAANVWASLRKFGNDTSGAIPWANNRTGIIHFAFNSSKQTLKSTSIAKSLQTSIADGTGFFVMVLLLVAANLLCVFLIVLPTLGGCICSFLLKRALYFRGALNTYHQR